MKQSVFIVLLILIMLPLIALPLFFPGNASVAGRIRIPSADISADVFAETTAVCDCCATLWHGGQASTLSDLSAVSVDDKAHLILLDGQHLVLECFEITPCIRVGRWLFSWRGIIRANGDILIVSGNKAYRWVIL